MATLRNQFQTKLAQVERISQVTAQDGEVQELHIMELEERIAPHWKRQYP